MPKKISKPKNKPKAKKILRPKLPRRKITRPEVKTEEGFSLHTLKVPPGAHQRKRILGRGPSSGHGKTSTRGSKGQTSRAGRDYYLGFEGGQTPLIRRIPKRGFTSKFKKEYQIVNLGALTKFKDTPITPALMAEKGLIKDKDKPVKILGEGELKTPANIQAHAFSKKAKAKIEAATGKIEILK